MKDWIIKQGIPFGLTLAADARLTDTDYVNDQIWEMVINRGDPPGCSLDTTYGLRGRKQRILPRFGEGEFQVIDPGDFVSPVTIQAYYPNYIKLDFIPIKDLIATLEYWIPDSHTVASRITLRNLANQVRSINTTWIALLTPDSSGSRMVINEIENATVLSGQTGNLHPVLFLGGGAYPSSGPFPGLELNLEIAPNKARSSVCVLASLLDPQSSFEQGRKMAALQWDAEIAKMEIVNSDLIQIITGEPDWDMAFDLSQRIASSLILSPTQYFPHRSFVQTRQPDQGYSIRGDGSDYSHLWNGQTVLQSWHLCRELLPGYSQIASDLILNFLTVQSGSGMIDWKPGLGNQRTSLSATPLLAYLSWLTYQQTQDGIFLAEIYPSLIKFYDYWFSTDVDKDQDGLPEWKHPWQTGLEDHPIFSFSLPESEGIDITTFECPDLKSWLLLEGQALLDMANQIGDTETTTRLSSRVEKLEQGVINAWDDEIKIYRYRDRDSHLCIEAQTLYKGPILGNQFIQQNFQDPVRLNFEFYRPGEATRKITIFIHGTSSSGEHRIERITPEQFRWHLSKGFATSDRIYTEVEEIRVEGTLPEDLVIVSTVGHKNLDISLCLPLFAHIPTPEDASQMVHSTLMNSNLFWQSGGLSSLPTSSGNITGEVNILWNSLMLQGMVKYNLHQEAAQLMTRIMNMLANSVTRTGEFHRRYNAETGEASGEKNSLEGLAPLGSFLKIVGIEFIDPWHIRVNGSNPFLWPVTVKYKGTTVLKHKAKTTVVFPDGQTMSINDEAPHILGLE